MYGCPTQKLARERSIWTYIPYMNSSRCPSSRTLAFGLFFAELGETKTSKARGLSAGVPSSEHRDCRTDNRIFKPANDCDANHVQRLNALTKMGCTSSPAFSGCRPLGLRALLYEKA